MVYLVAVGLTFVQFVLNGNNMTIEIEFTTKHEPGTPEHLEQILRNYFRAKGITYKDGKIII
jgi:hypothetical protein